MDGVGGDSRVSAEVVLQLFAHDARGALEGARELLARVRDQDMPAENRAFLVDRAMANLDRMHDLLQDVVDLERLTAKSFDPQPVSLAGVLHSAVELVPELDRLYVDCPAEAVVVDRRLVARALEKLLANAVAHTPYGTSVFLSARLEPQDRVVIVVADDGPGVPTEERHRIFEPFARGHGADVSTGLGLGLALVRRIAQLHGGDARVTERTGGGAQFEVEIVRGREATGRSSARATAGAGHPG